MILPSKKKLCKRRMSINPLLTNFSPNGSLFAPASGGGGGGGGSNNPNPSFSTLTVDSLMSVNNSINMTPIAAGQVKTPEYGFVVKTSNNASIYTFAVSDNDIVNDFKGVSTATATTGLRTLVNATNAYIGYPSSAGGQDGGQLNLEISTLALSAPSTLSITAPSVLLNGQPLTGGGGGSVPGNLTVSSLTLAGNPTALGATLSMFADDTDLYQIACVSSATTVANLSIGSVGGRDQVYTDVLEAPAFYTSTITGTTGQISLNPSGTEQIRIGGLGAPGDITINTVGGGLIKLNGPTVMDGSESFTAPNAATISSLTVSSVNGGIPYTTANPPPATTASVKYFQFAPENQTIQSGTLPNILNYSTITPSPVYSSINGFTLSGGLTCAVTFVGSGNTNPVTNVAGNSNASFGLYMILDGNYVPLTSLSFTTGGNSSPAGQYNSVIPSYNSNTNLGAFIVQPSYNFNSPSVSPGVEFTYTAFGAHTFQLFAWTDLFMNSGDPNANYQTRLAFPFSVNHNPYTNGILVQTF